MTNIQELIKSEYAKQYATNWYKVDEGSGTVLRDLKGSADGIITGGVWNNNESLTLNGASSYVTFPNNINIGGKRSIYLRIKINSIVTANTNPILDCSNNGTVSLNGFRLAVASSGETNYIAQSSKGQHVSIAISNTVISRDEMLNILITDSGVIEDSAVKIYINDLKTPQVIGARNAVDTYTTPTYGLSLGRQSGTQSNPWYSNITIYEMAIFKEDLSNTFLNKTLILHDGEYKKYSEESTAVGWTKVSTLLPSAAQFLEQGMDNLSPLLDRKITTLAPLTMSDKSEILDTGEVGKIFSRSINLKKYFDIRSIRTEGK